VLRKERTIMSGEYGADHEHGPRAVSVGTLMAGLTS